MKLGVPSMLLAVAIASTCHGQDKNWAGITPEDTHGTLFEKGFEEFQIGDWGHVQWVLKVLSVVNEKECLIISASGHVFLLRGFGTTGMVDGQEIGMPGPVEIHQTYNYTAASGGKKTVLVLENNDTTIKKHIAAKEAALVRSWTKTDSEKPFTAKFKDYKDGKVYLERKDDGKSLDISLSELSQDDQEWVRDLVKRQREKEKKLEQIERKNKKKQIDREKKKRSKARN